MKPRTRGLLTDACTPCARPRFPVEEPPRLNADWRAAETHGTLCMSKDDAHIVDGREIAVRSVVDHCGNVGQTYAPCEPVECFLAPPRYVRPVHLGQ